MEKAAARGKELRCGKRRNKVEEVEDVGKAGRG